MYKVECTVRYQWNREQTPFSSITELLESIAIENRDSTRALSFYSGSTLVKTLTYPQYLSAVSRMSARFLQLGVRSGDRIGTLMKNRLEVPITYLALMSIGAIVVPLNPTYTTRELRFVGQNSCLSGLVIDQRTASDTLAADLPSLRFIENIDGNSVHAPPQRWPPSHTICADTPAIILYTSGTTAFPKGVVQTHGNLISNALSVVRALEIDHPNQYSVMPFYHSHAVGFGLMTCLLTGGHLIVSEQMDPTAWKNVVRAERVTVTSMVPNLLQILSRTQIHRDEVPDLRFIFVSAAPLPSSIANDFEKRSGLKLVHAWGLSEFTNFATCLCGAIDEKARHRLMYGQAVPSVGSALNGVDVDIVDDHGEIVLAQNTIGELRVRGPSLMLGYDNNTEATQGVVRDGWLYSGDEGFFRIEGERKYFFITDRIKDLVNRSGEKISPAAVEVEITQQLPALENSLAALGFPHVIYGEEIGLVVQTANFELLRPKLEMVLRALPIRMRPKVILHGNGALRRTHTGKIQRRMLVPLFKPFERSVSALTIAEIPGGVLS